MRVGHPTLFVRERVGHPRQKQVPRLRMTVLRTITLRSG